MPVSGRKHAKELKNWEDETNYYGHRNRHQHRRRQVQLRECKNGNDRASIHDNQTIFWMFRTLLPYRVCIICVSLQTLPFGMIYLLFVYNPPPTERHTWKPKREQKRGSIARVTLLCNYPYTAAALHCLSWSASSAIDNVCSFIIFLFFGLLLMVFWNTLAFPVRNFKLLLKLSELCIIRLIDVFLLHCIWLKCPYENLKLLGNFKHVIPGTSITNRACRKKVLCCLCHLNSGGQAHCKMPCHTLKEPRISKVSAISHPWKLTMFPTTKSFRRLPASFRLILLASLSMVVYHLITSKETTFIPYTNGVNS